MQVSEPNNVKIYNLSAGKSLPEVIIYYTIIFLQIKLFQLIFSGFPKENEELC